MPKCLSVEYDVALSFAGEDRRYVDRVARALQRTGIKVFYDIYEDVNLWGKDLYQHLDDVYQNKAKYAVIFISESYKKKLWTNHELKSAQARAFSENEEYILPVRFDDTEIPGIRKTVGYISLNNLKPSELAKKIVKKIGLIEPENFLPRNIGFITQMIELIYEDCAEEDVELCVKYVFYLLVKLSTTERKLIAGIGVCGCRHDITLDFHQNISLFTRLLNVTRSELIDIVEPLGVLGFEYSLNKQDEHSGIHETGITSEYLSITVISRTPDLIFDNLTIILQLMIIGATRGMCEQCALRTVEKLNFTNIANRASDEELDEIFAQVGLGEDFADEGE